MMQQVNSVWSKPQLAPFSAGKYDWDFMLAPDNKTVYIASGRPPQEGGEPQKNYRIWTSKLTKKDWSEPLLLPFPVNSGQHDSDPSLTENNTLYFFSNRDGGLGEGDIYKSKMINGQYKNVENLGMPVNTKYHEVDPFFAPDKSYLITCSNKPGGFGSFDIYISFQKADGLWTKPKNMGDKINSESTEYIPYVTPDNKYFFFTSDKSKNREIY